MKKPWKTRRAILIVTLLVAAVAMAATIVGTNGTFTTTVVNGKITTTYLPNPGTPACNTIYMVQTCRDVDQNGNVIEPKDYKKHPFDHLQDDMTNGGTYVDHVVCEKDPYYNGEDSGKDTTDAGSRTANVGVSTSMTDRPHYSDAIFPDGVTSITSTFEVCAVCKDNGQVLDCFNWTYTRVKGDGTNGTVSSGTTASTPSVEFILAKLFFEAFHCEGTVCPEEIAEYNQGIPNLAAGAQTTTPGNPPPDAPFLMDWHIANLSGVDVMNVNYQVILDGMPLTGGAIEEIPYFDSEPVTIEMPPLPLGEHTVMLLVDPENEIFEYDETDNEELVELVISGATAAPEASGQTGIFMRMLQPNPTHGDFNVMLQVASDAPAHLMVIDVRGRVVQSRTIQNASGDLRRESFHLDKSLGAGMYFLRLQQGQQSLTRKFIMLR